VFRATLAEAQAAPLRLVILDFPGGMSMAGNQGMFSYDQALAPLAPLSSDILLLENLLDPQTEGVDLGHGCVRVHLTGDGRGVSEDIFSFTPPTLTSCLAGRARHLTGRFVPQMSVCSYFVGSI